MSEARPRAPRRSLPPSELAFGMLAPANPLVQTDGTPTPVTFRFLAQMYHEQSKARADITAIEARLAAAGIP